MVLSVVCNLVLAATVWYLFNLLGKMAESRIDLQDRYMHCVAVLQKTEAELYELKEKHRD